MINKLSKSKRNEFCKEFSNLNSNFKGQGTIEYLVIIAVVIVIALVVVGLVIGIFNSPSQQVSSSSNNLGLSSQVIGITESMIDPEDGNFVIRLLNNSGDVITVSNVSVGDTDIDFSEDLSQGSSKFFRVDTSTVCEEGKILSQDVIVTYVTRDGLVKAEKYPAKVMFDCTPYVIEQANLANQCPVCSSSVYDANAIGSSVLSGYTFFSDSSTKQNGSLVIGSYLHSKQNRCWNATNNPAACSSVDGNTIYQDARKDGNAANFTDLGDSTIKDNFTGLIWQKNSSAKMTWHNALGYCAQLNLGGYAVGSWRLPSNVELITFADYNCSAVSANCSGLYMNSAFTAPSGWGVMANYYGYWSSNTVPSITSFAYAFNSDHGAISYDSKSNSFYGAKCVR